ncbi:DUF559 domain-containing protein [Catellatospora sichuanensis]|uniref:DUF559 domain-containing protein n=1 Tax=Catellatospora sichuanensis TaxID=1969805 RepID=UPI001183717C|nr:DUF559 domain-containing protein [Catellatospora sichuanensis]
MQPALREVMLARDGLADRAAVTSAVAEHVLAYAVQAGLVARPLPRTFLLPEVLGDWDTVLRAALSYAGPPVAVSHLSALRVWGLPVPDDSWIHLLTGDSRHLRGAPGVRVHRREDFTPEPPQAVMRAGIPVTRLEAAVVDSWPLLDGDAKRAPAITAVSNRLTTPGRLLEEMERAPRLAGRRHLVQLLERLAAGCHSPLELWGYDRVFRGRAFARLRRQVKIMVGERAVFLDILDEETGLDIELDGAAYHSSPRDRERDLRRDAALTALGFTVVRFTGARLLREPDAVRAEVAQMMSHRSRRA